MADPVTRFHVREVPTRVGRVALVTIDNGADWRKPNTFGEEALRSLAEAVGLLEAGGWAGLVVTGKPHVFAAGADVTMFAGITPEQARAGGRAGHELFARIRALPFPTLAAVNGVCLGAGLELALHCDVRAVSRSARHLGFPEVFLGLFPAWGGTQLVPRLVGAAAAVKLIIDNPLKQNRMIDGAEVHRIGLCEHLLEPVEFLDDALELLVRRVEEGAPKQAYAADLSDLGEVCRKARNRVDDVVHGQAPAPYRALDLIAGAGAWTIEEGYAAEEDAIAELLPAEEAQASLYAFDVVERRLKKGIGIPGVPARPVRKVGVVGAGLMATQLATLFLRKLEVPIVLTDVDPARVEQALETIRSDLAALVARGRLDEGKARFLGSLATGGADASAYAGADLVLEAVFEELSVKRDVLQAVEAVVDPACLLVTNTSSLSVTAMADVLAHPERMVGMHFFNPVAVLPLVELVRTPATDDPTLATAWAVTGKLGKRGVLVRDAPAFVVNRLLTRQSTILMGAVENGASYEETDEAALRLGLPMAPSSLLALVGPRVAHHVLHTLHDAFPDRFPLSPTLAALANGDPEIVRTGDDQQSVAEIHTALLEALADECGHLLREGVVGSAAELDGCLILGAGFPFFRGGLTYHLDARGVSERIVGSTLAALSV
ncbi:MAG: 3-hydroxyacyl-CoA dehydrogenase [Thermoleophilia bacterium]|nr:3-hydroxyacyl-CoA dehydrogenase [Thermoleophilia bacterium]